MLRNRETVAGAVAREIDRIERTGNAVAEGSAYKAAWDRAGSNALKHCDTFQRDMLLMFSLTGCFSSRAKAYLALPDWRRA